MSLPITLLFCRWSGPARKKNELLRTIAEKQWAGFNHEWMRNINNNLNGIENETDRRARESAKHKQELYNYARRVGMIGGEENKTEQGYDDADSITD